MRKVFITLNLVRESIVFAFIALKQNKVRAFLSTLGITIGIFCIIAVLTMVDSLERNVQSSVESLGKDVIFVEKWPWIFTGDYKWWKYMNRPNPKMNELRTINEKSTLADAEALVVMIGNSTIKYESNSAEGITIMGVSHQYDRIKNLEFSSGRYFTEAESRNGSNVTIIGYTLAQTLFPTVNPIDKSIAFRGRKFRIVGVANKEGESMIGNSMDNQMLVPVQAITGLVRINSDRANAQIQVKAAPDVPLERMEEELRGIMRAQRKLKPGQEENFALNKTTLIAEPLKQLFGVITFAGWIIGGFAMLVGGFGIANIMFVSVKERTNQIGIQKSLGAKNYFILIEFLSESIMLCLVGGAIGISLVAGISYFVKHVIDFNIYISTGNVITGFTVSAVIGLISGLIPAYTASQLNPVDAIRAK